MIALSQIYLINTVDKSPYVFNFDSTVFNAVTPSTTIDLNITTLELKTAASVSPFLTCFTGYLDSDVMVDFEQQRPFNTSLSATKPTSMGTPIYNHRFNVVLESTVTGFNRQFASLAGYFASNTWQIIYKSGGQWFICYAEFSLIKAPKNDEVIQSFTFESKDSKEETFTITNFSVS